MKKKPKKKFELPETIEMSAMRYPSGEFEPSVLIKEKDLKRLIRLARKGWTK